MSQELWRDVILLHYIVVWLSYFMMTPSNWNVSLQALCAGNSPVTGECPSQRPVTRSFDIFFELHLNIRLSKQSRCQWFETPLRSLWRHSNVTHILQGCRTSRISYCSWTIVWFLQCQWSNPGGSVQINHIMVTSSNGNIFRVIDLLCGEFTGHRGITHTKASDAEHKFSLICAWTNSWAHNGDTGDLRRHRTDHDVAVMWIR